MVCTLVVINQPIGGLNVISLLTQNYQTKFN